MSEEMEEKPAEIEREEENEEEEFGELIKYTASGFGGGLALGAALDYFGLAQSGIGQWLVRTLAGEGESIFEGFYALGRRLAKASASMAEAYGWGKLGGMALPWVIDAASRVMNVNVYGIEGFYIPYFYALSDQICANVSGLLYLKRKEGGWRKALKSYAKNPVMISGLVIVLAVPAALIAVRALGFSPRTQVLTALETIAANLCWLPPLIGCMNERKKRAE